MALVTLRRLSRNFKQILVFLLLILLTLIWISYLRSLPVDNGELRKSDANVLIPGSNSPSDYFRSGRKAGMLEKRNRLSGIIRVNVNEFRFYDAGNELEGNEQDRPMGTAKGIKDHQKRIKGFCDTRKVNMTPSKVVKGFDSAGVNNSLNTQEIGLMNTNTMDAKSGHSSHGGRRKGFENPLEKSTNISRENEKFLMRGKEKLRNIKEAKITDPDEKNLVSGHLNVHTWFDICSFSVDSLRNFLLFPIASNRRSYTRSLNVSLKWTNYGQRLFGYLRPSETGNYTFCVSSRGSIELWLSKNKSPDNVRVIAKVNSADKDSSSGGIAPGTYRNISTSVMLKSGDLYYLEILLKHGQTPDGHFEILWRNAEEKGFSPIQSFCLVAFRDSSTATKEYHYNDTRIYSFARDDFGLTGRKVSKITGVETAQRHEFLQDHVLKDLLPVCEYKPSYLIRHKLVRFQGARNQSNTRFVTVYPQDSSNESLAYVDGEWWKERAIGNKVLHKRTASTISKTFLEALEQKHPRKYTLQELVSISSTEDTRNGVRFLLSLKIYENRTNSTRIFTDYVFQRRGESTLCFPKNFRWNPTAVVHVIIPVKDASPWVLALVKNIEQILLSTEDQQINVVIADYGSKDMDIEKLFKESTINKFQVVTLPQDRSFNRAEALQEAANAVQDRHGILFFCDLHLSMPSNLFTLIRQHCVEGKMAFAPVVKRLRCGHYPSNPSGYWETLGFGLFAIYKSDFDRAGGMDVHSFKQWGGEDWELLDRVLEAGLEVERLKVPAFYHFYHPPLGLSNQRADV